jgi:hypothetical protein
MVPALDHLSSFLMIIFYNSFITITYIVDNKQIKFNFLDVLYNKVNYTDVTIML